MEPRTIILAHDLARERACQAVMQAQDGAVCKIRPPTRTLDQNAALWPLLDAFSAQLQWPINGKMVNMEPEDWKDVLSAAFRRESVRVAMALDGAGVVMLGMRTSKMGKAQFSDWLDFLHSVAVDRGVDVGRNVRGKQETTA